MPRVQQQESNERWRKNHYLGRNEMKIYVLCTREATWVVFFETRRKSPHHRITFCWCCIEIFFLRGHEIASLSSNMREPRLVIYESHTRALLIVPPLFNYFLMLYPTRYLFVRKKELREWLMFHMGASPSYHFFIMRTEWPTHTHINSYA